MQGSVYFAFNSIIAFRFIWLQLHRLPVTSPQKLRHMVTSPHFEKVRGDVGIVGKCVGM